MRNSHRHRFYIFFEAKLANFETVSLFVNIYDSYVSSNSVVKVRIHARFNRGEYSLPFYT